MVVSICLCRLWKSLVQEKLDELVRKSILDFKDVIIDETNITRASRINIVKKFPSTYKPVLFWCPEVENNLEYRMKNSRGMSREKWSEIIDSMKERFRPPIETEGYELIKIQNPMDTLSLNI